MTDTTQNPDDAIEPTDAPVGFGRNIASSETRDTAVPFGRMPNFHANMGINHRNISNIIVYNQARRFFGSLATFDHPEDPIRSTRATRSRKARLQSGRRLQQAINNRSYYEPYAEVKNRAIKRRLIYLASNFNFLDRCFAEYFRSVMPYFDQGYVRQHLKDIRQDIAKRQNSDSTRVADPKSIYLGDLGEYCEKVSEVWDHDRKQVKPVNPRFNITHCRDREIFEYLQDAFEAPYWELMLDTFLQWRTNSESLIGDIVLKVFDSLEMEIETNRKQLLKDIESQSEDRLEDLAPILEGIDARIAVLNTLGDLKTPLLLEMEQLVSSSVHQLHHPQPTSPDESSAVEPSEALSKEKENVGLIALILLFLTAAIVPGYKAFSISMKSSEPGSVQDADFWYLIQSSIMSVLGNLTMVIPLLKKSWFSPAYSMMWMFFALGVAFAAISIIIYPFANTGWSSMVAFFGSIASAASVLVMTQAAAKVVPQKIKKD
ncbi:uncharacterized protein N7458_005907 [Penicillium daleae]|uniref:Uncharacterized protein n=1 Tax=Penicillium daleae TaxID=63821 RepID=A0AAD6G238_9EURO|nr:uncharacterized protein N7458_005907 [Penicillium daleae]KAJ5449458.1 hypothetical protein N7458_005907 [Penicillium daleae]